MSLFTNARDIRLPLLTQFYQLEIPPPVGVTGRDYGRQLRESGSELWKWALRSIQLAIHLQNNPKGGTEDGWREIDVRGLKDEDMAELADLHPLLRRLMDNAADAVMPAKNDEERIKAIYSNVLLPQFPIWRVSPDAGGKQRVFAYFHTDSEVRELLIREMVRAFVASLQATSLEPGGLGSLVRCAECRSPFVIDDPRRRFCSDRCSGRQRQRNASKKSKEITPEIST